MLDHVSLDDFFPNRIRLPWLVTLPISRLYLLLDQTNPFLATTSGDNLG